MGAHPYPNLSDMAQAYSCVWLCLALAQEVWLEDLPVPTGAGVPCSRCGSLVRWVFDRAAGTGAWSCTAPTGAGAPPA